MLKMGKSEKRDDELDKDSRKRLEKLEADWAKPPASYSLGGLSASDLRLLLEHCEPLQDLLRRIVAGAGAPATAAPASSSAGFDVAATEELRAELARTRRELKQSNSDRQKAKALFDQIHQECQKVQGDLTTCTAEGKKLKQANEGQKQEIKMLETELQEVRKRLKDCQASQASAPPELALLRGDPELSNQMGLTGLPTDNTHALIRMVAVLAQRVNLERLWGVLKERCESSKRPASTDELALLESALAWHNHNWPARPYRLIEVAPGNGYDFEQHLRSRHNSRGETVAALHLPGIADGGGHIVCKALVHTR